MKERETNPNTPLLFSFICPKGREGEVMGLFEESNLGVLNSEFTEGKRNWINPDTWKITVVSGYEFSGFTTSGSIKRIITSLSERKIAAYSRETQVIFNPLTNFDD